jgi:hypothetical protein
VDEQTEGFEQEPVDAHRAARYAFRITAQEPKLVTITRAAHHERAGFAQEALVVLQTVPPARQQVNMDQTAGSMTRIEMHPSITER